MMEKIFVPRKQLNVETNLKYSSNVKKHGHPPSKVTVGGVLVVEFESPKRLVTYGVYVEPRVLKLLVDNVPGFKALVDKG